MEPWQQHILKGLQARHALYVESVDDVISGHMHLHNLYLSQMEKNDTLKAKLAAQERELDELREYRTLRNSAENSSDYERSLDAKISKLERVKGDLESNLSKTKEELSNAKAFVHDLRSKVENLNILLERETSAHERTRKDRAEEINQLKKTAANATDKNRDSASLIDQLTARALQAEADVKKLVEEKFKLQSQLLAANSNNNNNNNSTSSSPTTGGGASSGSPGFNSNAAMMMNSSGNLDEHGKYVFRVPSHPKSVLQDAHAADIQTVCFSEGSKKMFSGGYDKAIKMFDCQTSQCRQLTNTPTSGTVMCIDSKANYVVTGNSDNVCRLYTLSDAGLRAKCQFTSHTESVDAAYLSLDAERVFSTSRDSTIRSWNVIRETLGQTTMCTSTANDIALHSSVIASAHRDRSVRFYDTRTGRIAGESSNLHDGSVTSVRFLNDARFTVSLSRDNTVRVCDVRTLREVEKFTHEKLSVLNNYMKLCVSPDSQYVAVPSAGDNGCVLIWEPKSSDSQSSASVLKGGHSAMVNSVSWSDDGKHIASCGADRKIVLWC